MNLELIQNEIVREVLSINDMDVLNSIKRSISQAMTARKRTLPAVGPASVEEALARIKESECQIERGETLCTADVLRQCHQALGDYGYRMD